MDLPDKNGAEQQNWGPCAGLFPFILAFDDADVAIDGKIGEALNKAAGLGPFDFDRVELFMFAQAENDARIVRREIAAAAYFETCLLQIAGLIGNARADGVGVGFFAFEIQAEPAILGSGIVAK